MNAKFLKHLPASTTFALPGGGELAYVPDVSKEMLDAYLAHLDGLELLSEYARNTIGSSEFRTYRVSNDGILNVAYTGADCSLRLVTDPLLKDFRYLPPQQILSRKEICQPVLTVLPLDYTHRDMTDGNGMGYAVLLQDGTYLIWDGGYPQDAERLFAYLYEHTPLPDHQIVISAWILTHAHGDHYGCFRAFTRKYAELVTVRYFLTNPPQADEAVINPQRVDPFLLEELPKLMERYPDSRAIRVHTGWKMAFHGAELEILQTYEDLLPVQMDWLNEASTVTRLRIAGQTILFTADCELKGEKSLLRLGDALKCDFLQIPHHGYSGGSQELWDFADPAYLLWTTNYDSLAYRLLPTWRHGLYLSLYTREGIQRSWAADGAVKEIPLPLNDPKAVRYVTLPNPLAVEQSIAADAAKAEKK